MVTFSNTLSESDIRIPLFISTFAVALSLLFSFVVFPVLQHPLDLNIDPDRIGELGSNIYHGKGFVYNESSSPAVDRGPTYPYLLAGIFCLTGGAHFTAVQIFQAVCHGLTCFVIFLVAGRIFERRVALVAQLLVGVHPMLIWYSARIWIETVNTLAVTFVMLTILILSERLTLLRSVGAGVAMGIAALTKSIIILFPLVAGVYLFLRWRKESLSHFLLIVFSMSVLVLPWTIRNYSVSGQLIPVHTSLGLNLIQGDVIGEYWLEKPYSTIELWHLGKHRMDSLLAGTNYSATDPIGDRILIRSSLYRNMSHPFFFVKRLLANAIAFWYLSESKLKSLFLLSIQVPVLFCVIIGSVRLWKKNRMIRPLVLLIAYYVISHSLVVGWARYSLPIVPMGLTLVAYAVATAFAVLEKKRVTLH